MEWKHIVIEGTCTFNLSEDKKKIIPECCKNDPGKISSNCLKYASNKYCPYLGIGTARSSLVLTDKQGEAIIGTCFFDDLELSQQKWEKNEADWLKEQIGYIENT